MHTAKGFIIITGCLYRKQNNSTIWYCNITPRKVIYLLLYSAKIAICLILFFEQKELVIEETIPTSNQYKQTGELSDLGAHDHLQWKQARWYINNQNFKLWQQKVL